MSSYLKFLSRNKLYSIIEAIGLAVSLAFVVIIFCYVTQQIAVTRENPHRKEIYAVGLKNLIKFEYGLKGSIGESIPEIESITEFQMMHTDMKTDDQSRAVYVLGCDRDFFDIFPVEFAVGQPDQINEVSAAFVSERMAQLLSETGEVVGRNIHLFKHDYTVAGVISDFGSSLFYETPDVIVNVDISDGVVFYGGLNSPSRPANVFTTVNVFVKVLPNTDRATLLEKMSAAIVAFYSEILGMEPPFEIAENTMLVRLDELFYTDAQTNLKKGDKTMMHSLLAIGLLLLISAIFNYINLNVALTSKRAKEMASRRLLGATKGEIIRKYLWESLAFTSVCMVLGILLAEALCPMVNRLLGGSVGVRVSLSPFYLVSYLLMVVVVALLAGITPAVVVLRAQPIDVVKGTFRFRNKMVLSKVFIVLQNVIAIVLIALVITMEVQMRHMQRRHVGCRTENLFYAETLLSGDEAFENDLMALPCVKRMGHSYGYPGGALMGTRWMPLDDRDNTDNWVNVRYLLCDTTAFDMFEFDVKALYGQLGEDQWLLTQGLLEAQTGTPLEQFDIDSLGVWYKRNLRSDICGVLSDFVITDAAHVVDETFGAVQIVGSEPKFKWVSYHPVLEIVGDHAEARKAIKDLYDKHMNKKEVYWEPWTMDFIDNLMLKHLQGTKNKMRLVDLFMAVAVMLSLLGLVAMSTHFASEREKTIAVRKVFGGTMQSEIRRNLKEYIIMILIANVIAIPIAVWVCGRYLEDFVYRIDLYPWIFVVTVMLSFVIAIGSVLWQIVSVARVNPVMALKQE